MTIERNADGFRLQSRDYILQHDTGEDGRGLVSLWDVGYGEQDTATRLHREGKAFTGVIKVTFADGSIGLLPAKVAEALRDVYAYGIEQEEAHFEEVEEEGFGDVHIVHAYRAIEIVDL